METPFVVRLEDIDGSQVALGGGKGASLGELIRAGVRVPAGFVVTRPAFDAFMSAADSDSRVAGWLATVDTERKSVAEVAHAIVELLGNAPIPEAVASAIETAAERLDVASVSVRSSATCEDGTASAWAGQLETFLDVGPDDLLSQVRACWLSMFSASALAYGAAHGYGAGQFGVAVVVQNMVSSEVSGIGFSVHPVTQEPQLRLIEACFGLGDAIVSGEIAPDQYVVKSGAREIVGNIRGRQLKGLFLETGTAAPVWRELGARGAEPKLSEAQILEFAGLLDRIETHYGHPVDTEWALAGGVFHLLQARPITTLAEEYREQVVDDSQPWMQTVRRPLPLLEASIVSHWMDSQHAGTDFGIHVDRYMSIQDEAGLTTMFVSQTAMEAALAHIRDLELSDRDHLVALLRHGHEVYRSTREFVEQSEGVRDIDQAANLLIELGRFTTGFPAWTLIAMEQTHLDDPEVRELAEGLRARSLYTTVSKKLIEPIARQMVSDLGFAQPERVQDLVTWRELHEGRLDRETLEERRDEVQAGRRFVYQLLGDDEQVRFVSETGYLLMREAGQRQIIAPGDPNCISGQAAWPGVHRGRARVVMTSDPSGIELEDGDVLVSIQANPNLMTLLRHAGAIVTDDGGVACHAAIICRELKIPTLIGTGRATSTIHDGDFVEVDATAQVVRILERAS